MRRGLASRRSGGYRSYERESGRAVRLFLLQPVAETGPAGDWTDAAGTGRMGGSAAPASVSSRTARRMPALSAIERR